MNFCSSSDFSLYVKVSLNVRKGQFKSFLRYCFEEDYFLFLNRATFLNCIISIYSEILFLKCVSSTYVRPEGKTFEKIVIILGKVFQPFFTRVQSVYPLL